MSTPFSTVNLNTIKKDVRTNSNTSVRKTGAQTIEGEKTFSNELILGSAGIKFSDATTLTTAPSGGAPKVFWSRLRTTPSFARYDSQDVLTFNANRITPQGVTITSTTSGGTFVQVSKTGTYQYNVSMLFDPLHTPPSSGTLIYPIVYQVVKRTTTGQNTKLGGTSTNVFDRTPQTGTGSQAPLNVSGIAELDATDKIFVRFDHFTDNAAIRASSTDNLCMFSGFLIAEA